MLSSCLYGCHIALNLSHLVFTARDFIGSETEAQRLKVLYKSCTGRQ